MFFVVVNLYLKFWINVIQVDNLSVAYGNFLFNDATFSLQRGEKCGLLGRNGSGKSTLFGFLIGGKAPDSGSISIRKGYRIGALSQHLSFTENSIVNEAAKGLPDSEKDNLYKVEAILSGLGFSENDMQRSPAEFSGGYQLRLHLTKLLVADPDCLLLDEPTNYLDIVSIRWLTKFLQNWQGEMILISHDREFMDSVTTHTMGIYRQKVRKCKGGTESFFESILQEEEVHEKTRQNTEKKKAHLQSFIDRFGAKATKAVQARSREKMISRMPVLEKLKAIHSLDFEFAMAPFGAKRMLEAKDLYFNYSENTPQLLENFSLTIEKGDRIAIIGKNGRGKSTLLKVLSQELKPVSGAIKIADNVSVGYFGQTNIDRLHPEHTIAEEIQAANPQLNTTDVKGICGVMMFSGDQSEKKTNILSGGEKSRVLLGKILASPCNMLLLDEPTHHLDMESIEALVDALDAFKGAVVFVTHSELILRQLELNKIVICHNGYQEVFMGGYDRFLEDKGWGDAPLDTAKGKKKGFSLKEEKQKRAEQVVLRSKILKPLDAEIAKKEKEIAALEILQDRDQHTLVELSMKRDSKGIQELSKTIASQKAAIDQLYEDLEVVMIKREEAEASFL